MLRSRRRATGPAPSPVRTRALVRRGVVGAVLAAASLAGLWAVSLPVYWPVDELSHVAYAALLAEGDLPTISTPIADAGVPGLEERAAFERATGRDDRLDVWTANHPPLYYALAALPLAAGSAAGAPGAGFLGARAVSVLAAALGVGLTAVLARQLVPDRPRVAVGAAAFAALVPALGHFGGTVFNDSLSFALCTLLLVTALRALDDGSTRAAALVGLAGAAAALTRVSALPLVALATLACAAGAWRAGGGGRAGGSRWPAAVRAAALAGGLPAVGAGWFYVRNWLRYGDLTGSAALLDKFDRAPNAGIGELLLGADLYVGQWDRLLADLATGVWVFGWRVPLLRALGVVILAGLALAAVERLRGGLPGGWQAGEWLPGGREAVAWRWAGWLVAGGFPAALLLATARFHAEGGSPHARYLLSALAVVALVAVLGLDRLGRRRAPWPLLGGLGVLAVLHVGAWLDFRRMGDAVWEHEGRLFPLLPAAGGWGEPAAVVLLVAAAAGLALTGHALVALGPEMPDRAGAPQRGAARS